jgi:hypothetical protein
LSKIDIIAMNLKDNYPFTSDQKTRVAACVFIRLGRFAGAIIGGLAASAAPLQPGGSLLHAVL